MSPNSLQSTEFSAPGKVFILGEYAILGGLPAVVAAVGPRFRVCASRSSEDLSIKFRSILHSQSPAARLMDWAEHARDAQGVESQLDLLDLLEFEDPHLGNGGFGGSTAQFALVYRALAEANGWPLGWERVWRLYRELTSSSEGVSPSGADLVAQWQGGTILFENGAQRVSCEDLSHASGGESILVFSAASQQGRKVATHEHLAKMKDAVFMRELTGRLLAPLSAGISALRAGDPVRLGASFNEYAEILRESGLEIEATTRDRRAFQRLAGVVGVKGAGAMQADALVVALKPEAHEGSQLRKQVLQMAQERQLGLIANGLDRQHGVFAKSYGEV